MNAALDQLVSLQAQDLTLRRLRQELVEAPQRVAKAETALKAAQAALASATSSLAKEETLRRSQELDVASSRGKIARLQRQMETATSAAQITALEHEIEFATRGIAALEDEELASMERTEQFEGKQAAAQESVTDLSAVLDRTRTSSADLVAKNNASIKVVEAERATLRAAAASLDEALLGTYDRVAKAKGTALSEAVDHKCAACQMMVRPQRWNDLTDRDPKSEFANTIFTCETCGRMLYFDPRRDAPVAWTAGERLDAATYHKN